MDKEKFAKTAKMFYIEEKMKKLYIEMLDIAEEQDVDDLVNIGSGLFKIYERYAEKLELTSRGI